MYKQIEIFCGKKKLNWNIYEQFRKYNVGWSYFLTISAPASHKDEGSIYNIK